MTSSLVICAVFWGSSSKRPLFTPILNSPWTVGLSKQMTSDRADTKDLASSQQDAAEARSDMQAALQMSVQHREESRAVYQTRVKQRLVTMEEAIESSIRDKVDQKIAPRTQKVSYCHEYKADLY